MKKSTPKRATGQAEYKHREILTWRGLTYRYDKTFGEWRLVDKPAPWGAPKGIMGWGREQNGRSQWEVHGCRASDPVAALEKWISALIDLRSREAREATALAKRLEAEVRRLRSKSLRDPPGGVRKKGARKRAGVL